MEMCRRGVEKERKRGEGEGRKGGRLAFPLILPARHPAQPSRGHPPTPSNLILEKLFNVQQTRILSPSMLVPATTGRDAVQENVPSSERVRACRLAWTCVPA